MSTSLCARASASESPSPTGRFTRCKSGRFTCGKIVNGKHVERLRKMVLSSGGKVVLGDPNDADAEACWFPPTCVSRPDAGSPLLTDEVFGPVLSVVPVSGVDEAIGKAKTICASPLHLYVFSEDSRYVETVLGATASGMVTVNDVGGSHGIHLPFGGVGESGMGSYGGKAGFDQFSHRRGVLVRSTAAFMPKTDFPPPVKGKVPAWFYSFAMKVVITGFIPKPLKTPLKLGLGAVLLAVAYKLARDGGLVAWVMQFLARLA